MVTSGLVQSFIMAVALLISHVCVLGNSKDESQSHSIDTIYGRSDVSDHVRLLYDEGVCPAVTVNSQSSVKSHMVDLVFLMEYSQTTNATYIKHFSTALQSLVSSLKESGASDLQFAVVLYTLEQGGPVVFKVGKFSFFLNGYSLQEVKNSVSDQAHELKCRSSKEMSYLAVDRALQMLDILLNGDPITDLNGNHHSIVLQPFATVIVGLGLYEKNDDNNHTNADITARRRSIERNIELLLEHMQTMPHIAIHVFFPRDVRPAVEFIGSSRHEVRYRDCTHLNKALTLKALLDEKSEASSLQAHMLALGRDFHIMELSALTRPDCVRAISSIVLLRGTDLHHIDKCVGDDECDTMGSYCSPLHGCVMDSLSTSGVQQSLVNDKMLLTGQLTMSHADLVKLGDYRAHPIGDNYPSEELSILRTADSIGPTFSLSDVVVGKPRTLKVSPKSEFAERLIKSGKPVVLKNSVVGTWTATRKWNFPYLMNHMGSDVLQLVKSTDDFLTFDPDRTAPLKLNIALPFTETNMSTSLFFSCIKEPSICTDGYRGHYYFGSIPETLRPDLNSTRKLFHTDRDYKANKQFMWISSAGMITHGHFDQDYNFFVQLIGRKRFTLWSSSQHELMYIYPRVHPLWHKSRINFRSPDLTRFPNFAKSRALQVVVEPGDILYVPPYTWHYVETLSPSVSLSTWSHDYDLYHHMNAIYRHDHRFDLIQDSRGLYTDCFHTYAVTIRE